MLLIVSVILLLLTRTILTVCARTHLHDWSTVWSTGLRKIATGKRGSCYTCLSGRVAAELAFKMAASIQVVSPEEFPIEIVKWKVKKDSMVMKGSVLALYKVQNRSQIKLKSTATGIVDEILVEAGMKSDPGCVFRSSWSSSVQHTFGGG